ncbi:hypothetical protein C0585_06275 [Candidatus Woesearchaeota archaeon]|nr:MAG: hypothetical protein C0585_06275 [Candidatus Woesearchaeota archaeon]
MGGKKEEDSFISVKKNEFEERLKELRNLIGEVEEVEEPISENETPTPEESSKNKDEFINANISKREKILNELYGSIKEVQYDSKRDGALREIPTLFKSLEENQMLVKELKDIIKLQKEELINKDVRLKELSSGLSNPSMHSDTKLSVLEHEKNKAYALMDDLKKIIKIQKSELDKKENSYNNLHEKHQDNNDYMSNKLKILEDEKSKADELMDDLKKIIKIQKDELSKKDNLIRGLEKEFLKFKEKNDLEKFNKHLESKHDSIKSLHNITRELTEHYTSRLKEYNDTLRENKKVQEKIKEESLEVIRSKEKSIFSLKEELEKSNKALEDLKKVTHNQDSAIRKRDELIEELGSKGKKIANELTESKAKKEMYEKISLKSKNEALTAYEVLKNVENELESYKEKDKLYTIKIPQLQNQIESHKKQIEVIKNEYDKRVQSMKDNHQDEITNIIKEHTRKEMNFKSQLMMLNEELDKLNSELAFEKNKQKQFANEVSQKMSTLFKPILEDKPIIYNVPNNIREDYELLDNE